MRMRLEAEQKKSRRKQGAQKKNDERLKRHLDLTKNISRKSMYLESKRVTLNTGGDPPLSSQRKRSGKIFDPRNKPGGVFSSGTTRGFWTKLLKLQRGGRKRRKEPLAFLGGGKTSHINTKFPKKIKDRRENLTPWPVKGSHVRKKTGGGHTGRKGLTT